MKNIWQWLNEKKTVIGASFFIASMVLQKMFDIWFEPSVPDWGPKLVETLEWFGGIFTGVGLSHKGIKLWTQQKTIVTPQ